MKVIQEGIIKYKIVIPETEEEKLENEQIIYQTCCSSEKYENIDFDDLKKGLPYL